VYAIGVSATGALMLVGLGVVGVASTFFGTRLTRTSNRAAAERQTLAGRRR